MADKGRVLPVAATGPVALGRDRGVRKGEVETLEHMRDRGLAVTVYFGQRKGSASTADLSSRAVAETVAAACDIARHTAEDPCAGLPDPQWQDGFTFGRFKSRVRRPRWRQRTTPGPTQRVA